MRYRGRAAAVRVRRWLNVLFAFPLLFFVAGADVLSGLLMALILVLFGLALGVKRVRPFLLLDVNSKPPVLLVSNWFHSERIEVGPSSTLKIQTKVSYGFEKHRRFVIESPSGSIRSGVRLGGAGGFADSEKLAKAWFNVGGRVVGDLAYDIHRGSA